MRVYLPLTLPLLARAVASGDLGPGPATAFAVTPALREWFASGDEEELEYAAATDAAVASLRLLHRDPAAPRRRVVVSADVPDVAVSAHPDLGRAVVRVAAPIPMAKVASVHVDEAEAEADVRAAAEAVVAADLGDEDAQFVVDGAEGHELQWWATQEIPDLLG